MVFTVNADTRDISGTVSVHISCVFLYIIYYIMSKDLISWQYTKSTIGEHAAVWYN